MNDFPLVLYFADNGQKPRPQQDFALPISKVGPDYRFHMHGLILQGHEGGTLFQITLFNSKYSHDNYSCIATRP